MDDLIIRGAQVIDGRGTPGQRLDVAGRDGCIRVLASGLTGPAQRVIDATFDDCFLVPSPGGRGRRSTESRGEER